MEFTQPVVVKHVLLMIAMESEAQPVLSHLQLTTVDTVIKNSPFIIHSGTYKDCTVSVVTNGKDPQHGVDNVGTTPAALATFLAIHQLKPDLVINAGTAGGFRSKTAQIGDVFISTRLMHHDRRIPIPGFAEYGKGNHNSIACPALMEHLGCKSGVVTTANSLDHNETDLKIMQENDASVKDMEGAAIAWTCELSQTPFLAIKVVTDIVDGGRPTEVEFFENLGAAARSLQATLPKVLDFVVGKEIKDL